MRKTSTVSRVSGVSGAGLTKDSLNTHSYLMHLPYEATAQRETERDTQKSTFNHVCLCPAQGSEAQAACLPLNLQEELLS